MHHKSVETLKPLFSCLQQVDSHYDLAVATFYFLTGMWFKSSLYLQKQRRTDVLADSMETILHMIALQRAPKQFSHLVSDLHSKEVHFDQGNKSHLVVDFFGEIKTKIRTNEIIELWNFSMEDASLNDALSARFVAILQLSADLHVPFLHSPLCFTFSLRLLFDNRATAALDICEYWLEDLEKTRKHHPESFVWYRIGLLACKALACSILSQGIKARVILKQAQDELDIYDLPGLRAYISFIGLLAAGALCKNRQTADKTSNLGTTSIWTTPNLWKASAITHTLHFHAMLVPVILNPAEKLGTEVQKNTSKSGDRLSKRRLSNVFEDHEVRERESFLKDAELMLMILNMHTSLVTGMGRMRHFTSAELAESNCIFADLWEHMLSWKSELDRIIVSASVQKQQL